MNKGEKLSHGIAVGLSLGAVALPMSETALADTWQPIKVGSASPAECADPNWNASKRKQIADMLCRHNSVRPTVRLVLDPVLAEAAQEKLNDIENCHDFSHTACNQDPFVYVKPNLTPPWHIEENLGYGVRKLGSSHAMFGAWRKSPTHWSNIINERVNRVGFALGHYDELTLDGVEMIDVNLWVAEFAGQ